MNRASLMCPLMAIADQHSYSCVEGACMWWLEYDPRYCKSKGIKAAGGCAIAEIGIAAARMGGFVDVESVEK